MVLAKAKRQRRNALRIANEARKAKRLTEELEVEESLNMPFSKVKLARLAALRKARNSKKLAEQLNQSGYHIKVEESEHVDELESVKVEVKEELEGSDTGNENEDDFFWRSDQPSQQDTLPVVPPSSTIPPSYPRPNERSDHPCLLCYKKISTSGQGHQWTDCEESSFRTMFLMKKMFNVPNSMLEAYLQNFGSPGAWVSVCITCNVLVEKALGVQKRINQLEKSLRSCQQEMIGVVKKSQTVAQRYSKSYQNDIIRVTNEARKFVCMGAEGTDLRKKVNSNSQNVRRRPKASSCNIPDASPPSDFSSSQECPSPVTSESHHNSFTTAEEISIRDRSRKVIPLSRHVTDVVKTSTTTTYACTLCPHLNEMPLQSFLIHIIFHYQRPFRCSGCKLYYAHPKELDVSPLHQEKNRKEGDDDSSDHHVCTVDTLVETKFKPEQVWSCDQCLQMFDSQSERDYHEHQVYQNKIISDLKYKCKTCFREYKHFNDWRLHRVLEHPEVAALSCHFCDEYFGVSTKEGVDVLLNRETRRAHVKKQHGNNIFKYDLNACDHCGRNYETATELSNHAQEIHGLLPKKTYSCPICWIRVKYYTSLTTHLQSSHKVGCPEAYVCEICGYSATYPLTLAQHNVVKHGIRPSNHRITVHSCKSEGCKYESIFKGPLEKHMVRVHGADRKYTCQYCGSGFLDPKHCREHEKIHTNKTAKPYKCEICGNSFALKNYLYIHMRLSHLNRPFASTHKKRPFYRKKVTPEMGSSQQCYIGLRSDPVESTTVPPPPPPSTLLGPNLQQHNNT